jgi:hypothetical protein
MFPRLQQARGPRVSSCDIGVHARVDRVRAQLGRRRRDPPSCDRTIRREPRPNRVSGVTSTRIHGSFPIHGATLTSPEEYVMAKGQQAKNTSNKPKATVKEKAEKKAAKKEKAASK